MEPVNFSEKLVYFYLENPASYPRTQYSLQNVFDFLLMFMVAKEANNLVPMMMMMTPVS
jgi:hypothetical protein